MRAFLYDTLTQNTALQAKLGGASNILTRVMPRRSVQEIPEEGLFLIFGLGNATSEQLEDSTANDAQAERQFFQVWIHDPGGSYMQIDEVVPLVKKALVGKSHKPSKLLTIAYLETSQEFNNETYNTNFRYIRFQGIIAEGKAP